MFYKENNYILFRVLIFRILEVITITNCIGLKKGDTIICEECGLELTVSKSCDCGDDDHTCAESVFSCCGAHMTKK